MHGCTGCTVGAQETQSVVRDVQETQSVVRDVQETQPNVNGGLELGAGEKGDLSKLSVALTAREGAAARISGCMHSKMHAF